MKFISLLILTLLLSSKVYLQKSYVLEGKVGNYPIVMLLEESFDKENKKMDVSCRYYYKSNRHDIELEGEWKNKVELTLKKEDNYDSTVYELFNLKRQDNNTWVGNWKGVKGKILPVVLQPIDTLKYAFNEVPELNDIKNEERVYIKCRLAGLKFRKDSITHSGNYTLQWWKESLSSICLFRITSGYTDNILKKINHVISKNQYANIDAFFSCNSRNNVDGEYGYNFQSFFISKNILSIHASEYYDCGGIHPDASNDNLNINSITGEEINDLDSVFQFISKKTLLEKNDANFDYIEERSKAIVKIISNLYPKDMKKPRDNDDRCDYSDIYHWNYPEWYFTSKGLYIAPTFSHAAAARGGPEFPIIPYAMLKKYLAPNSKLVLP